MSPALACLSALIPHATAAPAETEADARDRLLGSTLGVAQAVTGIASETAGVPVTSVVFEQKTEESRITGTVALRRGRHSAALKLQSGKPSNGAGALFSTSGGLASIGAALTYGQSDFFDYTADDHAFDDRLRCACWDQGLYERAREPDADEQRACQARWPSTWSYRAPHRAEDGSRDCSWTNLDDTHRRIVGTPRIATWLFSAELGGSRTAVSYLSDETGVLTEASSAGYGYSAALSLGGFVNPRALIAATLRGARTIDAPDTRTLVCQDLLVAGATTDPPTYGCTNEYLEPVSAAWLVSTRFELRSYVNRHAGVNPAIILDIVDTSKESILPTVSIELPVYLTLGTGQVLHAQLGPALDVHPAEGSVEFGFAALLGGSFGLVK